MMYISRYWTLYALLLLPLVYFVIFRYGPMQYILVAFKKYRVVDTLWEMKWAGSYGMEHFVAAFSNRDFLFSIRNTIILNLLDRLLGFPAPVILAILLNELAFKRFKRVTQTIAYMPHFLSWVIVGGMAKQILATNDGSLNAFFRGLFNLKEGIPFLESPVYWVFSFVLIGIWQSVGWNTIIYLAAITGISPELYEAAAVDGANRMRRIWHITLPGLRPTIVTLLILSMGSILGGDFERVYAFLSPLSRNVGTTIPVFVYEYGIRGYQYSLSTAVGFFQSLIGMFFLFGTNAIAKKFGERGVW